MLTRSLMVFHTMIAAATKTPELELDESEAKGLSESGLTLLSLYEIRPDPKVEAAIIFAGNVGFVYGTRIVAIRARKAQEAKAKKEKSAEVFGADGTPSGTTPFHREEWPIDNPSVQ